ncbi:MAG: LysM peptidoglycan-binding domain-containing protein [Cellvibrionaceae bacterium]
MKINASGIVAALLLSVICILPSHAADERFRDDFPERYIVQKGDTLWGISSKFLRSPWLWPEIWHANSQIENPHLIFPGDVISLVYIDGQPRLTVNRTTRLTPSGTDRLTPQIRVSSLDDAIPAIPLDQINSWLLRNRVVEPGLLEASPYVIAGQEKRLILGAGDRLYARGQFASNIPSYGVYRKGTNYIDPDTKEVLGVQAIDLGGANMRALNKDVATLSVTRSTGDVRIGDSILPTAERVIEPTFFPSEPEQEIKGKIIGVEGGVTQVGMLDVIAINKGEREGLQAGNVLSIYKRGEVVRDPYAKKRKDRTVYLPDERAGMMMIFQTFDKMSLALVLKADRGIKVGDYARQP